jgi:hypothetical protein
VAISSASPVAIRWPLRWSENRLSSLPRMRPISGEAKIASVTSCRTSFLEASASIRTSSRTSSTPARIDPSRIDPRMV